MLRTRRLLPIVIAFLLATAFWLWWVAPRTVDMATFAPANALLYLESDRPREILRAINATRAWNALATDVGASPRLFHLGLVERLVRWTGIGSIESVILLRSQIAVVITDLGASEEAETLKVKPEGVLIVETHTSEYRVRPFVQETLQRFADRTYTKPVFSRTSLSGTEYMEWTASDGNRQIVAVVRGSVVFVGNSRRSVQACLAASGTNSLISDSQLIQSRTALQANDALAFGYVSQENSARLMTLAVPLLFGRSPEDANYQRVVRTAAVKIFGTLAWSCKPYADGIEDRYLISLRPEVGKQLSMSFGKTTVERLTGKLPREFVSTTQYRFENSFIAWQGLRTAVSSNADALSAVLFSSLLKTALLSYGVSDPEGFLRQTKGEVATVRLDEGGERSLLLASVRDRTTFVTYAKSTLGLRQHNETREIYTVAGVEGDFSLGLIGEQIVIGTSSDVVHYVQSPPLDEPLIAKMNHYAVPTTPAQILTQTDDSQRIRSFVVAVSTMEKGNGNLTSQVDQKIATLPFAVTETTVTHDAIERVTRSPLGQFSFLFSLFAPEQSQSNLAAPLSR